MHKRLGRDTGALGGRVSRSASLGAVRCRIDGTGPELHVRRHGAGVEQVDAAARPVLGA
jgi:hypothetical protein